ncbi:hypothetical protein P280DRAFT_193923 [Massarina eburnea CBS 473.64]|uniref:Uncharacterized protein n=1 Tax=Massarina eburnea CBS 473.64 TaxID=1395130 RepID=A0A6A6RNA7_9PLEO|nr:hypothetical protein P280DRAFT_193923 [Massarina eburnea CBS 473.64]
MHLRSNVSIPVVPFFVNTLCIEHLNSLSMVNAHMPGSPSSNTAELLYQLHCRIASLENQVRQQQGYVNVIPYIAREVRTHEDILGRHEEDLKIHADILGRHEEDLKFHANILESQANTLDHHINQFGSQNNHLTLLDNDVALHTNMLETQTNLGDLYNNQFKSHNNHLARLDNDVALHTNMLETQINLGDIHINQFEAHNNHLALLDNHVALHTNMWDLHNNQFEAQNDHLAPLDDDVAFHTNMLETQTNLGDLHNNQSEAQNNHLAPLDDDVALRDDDLLQMRDQLVHQDNYLARQGVQLTANHDELAQYRRELVEHGHKLSIYVEEFAKHSNDLRECSEITQHFGEYIRRWSSMIEPEPLISIPQTPVTPRSGRRANMLGSITPNNNLRSIPRTPVTPRSGRRANMLGSITPKNNLRSLLPPAGVQIPMVPLNNLELIVFFLNCAVRPLFAARLYAKLGPRKIADIVNEYREVLPEGFRANTISRKITQALRKGQDEAAEGGARWLDETYALFAAADDAKATDLIRLNDEEAASAPDFDVLNMVRGLRKYPAENGVEGLFTQCVRFCAENNVSYKLSRIHIMAIAIDNKLHPSTAIEMVSESDDDASDAE